MSNTSVQRYSLSTPNQLLSALVLFQPWFDLLLRQVDTATTERHGVALTADATSLNRLFLSSFTNIRSNTQAYRDGWAIEGEPSLLICCLLFMP